MNNIADEMLKQLEIFVFYFAYCVLIFLARTRFGSIVAKARNKYMSRQQIVISNA